MLGRVILRFEEGHEALMRQALEDFAKQGGQLPSEVDPMLLTLGNVRTDVPNIQLDRKTPWWWIVRMMVTGMTCVGGKHPAHAMRCRGKSVASAYAEMIALIRQGFETGCDESASWETRALAFGSMLHTLQDSYCIAHATRIDNNDPSSPIIAMHVYPSPEHPFKTSKDAVWHDKQKTAFKPYAAAAISATVEALKFFAAQNLEGLDDFIQTYLSFRGDILGHN